MDKLYFTITGTHMYYGQSVLREGEIVRLEKDPDNKFDRETIQVKINGLGTVGAVANSVSTVRGESFSAGRLYDRIGDVAEGKIEYVLSYGALASLVEQR